MDVSNNTELKYLNVNNCENVSNLDLAKTFNRQEYLSIAKKFDINEKTAERYIKKLVDDSILNSKSHNNYINR